MNIYTKPEFEIIDIPENVDIITTSGGLGEDLPEPEEDVW